MTKNPTILITILFALIVLLFPISFFSLRLFNEPIFLIACIYAVCIFFTERFSRLDISIISLGLVFSTFFMAINILNFDRFQFVIKDLIEVCKPILFSALVVCGRHTSRHLEINKFVNCIVFVSVIQVIFSYIVFIPDFYDFANWYKGRPSTSLYNAHFFRFSGTMGFPSLFGLWIGFSMILIMFHPSSSNRFFKFCILASGLYFSQSRTGLVVFVASCFLFYLVSLRRGWDWKPSITHTFAFFLFCSIVLLFYSGQGLITDKFSAAAADISGSSLQYRLVQFLSFMDIFEKNPFGIGTANFYLESIGPVENVYFYYGVKFGVVGLTWFGLICLGALTAVVKFYRRAQFTEFTMSVWLFIALTVGSFSNAISLEYKSFFFFFLFLGVILGLSENIVKRKS